jgi:hypothetical protein
MPNRNISAEDLARMRELKANDWESPMGEREKEIVERQRARIMAEGENEARGALASGTHYVFDRFQIPKGGGKETDRLLNKRGRRQEDLLFEQDGEIVVLRKKEKVDG